MTGMLAVFLGLLLKYFLLIFLMSWVLKKAGMDDTASIIVAALAAFGFSLIVGSYGYFDHISADTIMALLPQEFLAAVVAAVVTKISRLREAKK